MTQLRPNDPAQYDDLADQWWDASGGFAALHWLATSRAEHIPPATPGEVLVDLACGGGLMAPHAARLGYRHVGVDEYLGGLCDRRRGACGQHAWVARSCADEDDPAGAADGLAEARHRVLLILALRAFVAGFWGFGVVERAITR